MNSDTTTFVKNERQEGGDLERKTKTLAYFSPSSWP